MSYVEAPHIVFFLQIVEEKVKLYDIIIGMIMQNQVCLGLLQYMFGCFDQQQNIFSQCVETSKGLKLAIPYHDPIVTGDPFVVPRLKWIGFQELGFD